ncbi:MAG: penicillin-binding protein 2 [Marinilabiliaceae bacterium]|nr:penicillin-binding protein 2 [Marinilabiliaceae bacterium]
MDAINNRSILIRGLIVLIGIIFLIKLYSIQVRDSSYKFSAESNTQRVVIQYPSRGLIFDRQGKLLVSNQAVYDIMVVPREIEPFDTIDFAFALGITVDELKWYFDEMHRNLKKNKISSYRPSVFIKQVSSLQYGILQEKLYKFKGFFVQRRTLRMYEYPNAAHIFGYINEVSEKMIKNDSYYVQGDYAGITGIEETYETILRGKKGAKVVLVDVHGREKGAFRNGRYDTAAVVGQNITLTLDIELQQYGEKLMCNKIGSIVAIEPATGEILALVSSPAYNPSLLIGRVRSDNYQKLSEDSLKPLFNRPLQALYPPGSTFKLLNALIGLQEGVISEQFEVSCFMGYHGGGWSVGCHSHKSPLKLAPSIQHSCNAYYTVVFRKILDNPEYSSIKEAFDKWKTYLVDFGLGYKLGVDFSNENRGFVPNSAYYNKVYNNVWNSVTVRSLGIGQGELLLTPLQMANMCAAIGNRGFYYTPHILKDVNNKKEYVPKQYKTKHDTGIDTTYFNPVIEGMELAIWGTDGGTARVAQIKDISICGKTGTAENPHGEDHSIFIAFAPKYNPKIAIAVYVENAGFGSTYAAPIASLLVERYLKGGVNPNRKYLEERMYNANLLNVTPKRD